MMKRKDQTVHVGEGLRASLKSTDHFLSGNGSSPGTRTGEADLGQR